MPRSAGRIWSLRLQSLAARGALPIEWGISSVPTPLDLPVSYKAPPPIEPGRFTVRVEKAIWTGGDPVYQAFSLIDFTTVGFAGGNTDSGSQGLGINSGSIPGIFDLNPKIGWEAATGFDYKFANSPWHVSGQFRYGEGGKTSGAAASSGTLDPTLLSLPQTDIEGCFSPIADSDFPGPGTCTGSPSPAQALSISAAVARNRWV